MKTTLPPATGLNTPDTFAEARRAAAATVASIPNPLRRGQAAREALNAWEAAARSRATRDVYNPYRAGWVELIWKSVAEMNDRQLNKFFGTTASS
jgi:hypothetical protein